MKTKKKREYDDSAIRTKFYLSLFVSVLWVIFSFFVSRSWIHDLAESTNMFVAVIIIGGIALVPGFINTFLVMSILLDKQIDFKDSDPTSEVTLLVAAYNEEKTIYDTLKYIKMQDYKGKINTIVINNNSTDNTVNKVNEAIAELELENAICITETKAGKFNALNAGLKITETKYVITLDADTLLHPKAIRHLMARIESAPKNIAAVAGSVLVRNSRDNLLTKLQEWDYFLSIMSIKRMQSLYEGTLVAQGAFSIYKTDIVRELGGWSDAIGEDIILTWQFLHKNMKVYFEPLAIAFTDAPTKFSHFAKQRSRWARGMIEGIRMVKPWNQPNLHYKFLTGVDLFIPYMDFSYTFFFIPGLVLACFGIYAIVGPFILLVLPLTLVTFGILYFKQKQFFKVLGLRVRKNVLGFIIFLLGYQIIMSPISLIGYVQELFGTKRVWK